MAETERSKKNLVILSIPPLLNYFDWKKDLKNQYFFLADISNRQEKFETWQKQGKNDLIEWVKSLNNEKVYSDKVVNFLDNPTSKKIILVNYPRNKESLQILEKELWIREKKQPTYFFVSFTKKLENDFVELQTENIICPLCEKSWKKKETAFKEENIFRCLEDKTEFNLVEVEKITQYLFNDYFEKAAQIIEYQKAKKNKIITLELSIKPDLEPENLQKFLLEKLEKEA